MPVPRLVVKPIMSGVLTDGAGGKRGFADGGAAAFAADTGATRESGVNGVAAGDKVEERGLLLATSHCTADVDLWDAKNERMSLIFVS